MALALFVYFVAARPSRPCRDTCRCCRGTQHPKRKLHRGRQHASSYRPSAGPARCSTGPSSMYRPRKHISVFRNQGAVMPSVWWLPRPAACWAHRLSVLGRQNAHRGELATLGPHRPRSAFCFSLRRLAGARSSDRTWKHGLEYASDHASQPRVPRGKGDRAADLFPDCGGLCCGHTIRKAKTKREWPRACGHSRFGIPEM